MSEFSSTDPATGEVVWQGAGADAAAVNAAVARARAAFPAWARRPRAERVAIVEAFAKAMEARRDELAQLISRETGKAGWEARAEAGAVIGKAGLAIRAYADRTGEARSDQPFGEAVLRHKPHGVMAVLGPYNFPAHLPNGQIIPALLAGNTIVFKPSELAPATGELMAEVWAEAGLPEGVLNLVQGARETGSALVEADIDGLLFTGSAATGMHFRRTFAERPNVILALELGGNNPLVAWDGDHEEVAALVIQSAFVTTGQRCTCARRLIVPDNDWGTGLVEAVAAKADGLRIGAWTDDPEPYMGPLVSKEIAGKSRDRFAQLAGRGGMVIRAMEQPEGLGEAFVSPGLLDVTGVEMPDDELFAPFLQVIRVPDFDGALAAANDTRFGLSAGLASEDPALWDRFIVESRAGIVNRNRPTTGAAGTLPFGGTGDSGNYRPGGWYMADACAWPVASFEAGAAEGIAEGLAGYLR